MKRVRFSLLIFCLNISFQINAQSSNHCNDLGVVIDSIKERILLDTLKYSVNNIEVRAGITQAIKSYSPLFVINEKYFYKLDIIEPRLVKEFIGEFLVSSKIRCIKEEFDKNNVAIYSSLGEKGVVQIKLKQGINFNPFVAGYKAKKSGGSNFVNDRQN